ncbi:hypothetical protein PLESTB_001111000 [Pleodorina starrii]|uniref:HotDog ACOT-type domain-containing protein n=1 Tax=Pleodorina starrii TaxID=330485 RepID=A0A9W6F4R3_9CHLO|nr:hypothetical protein PLESTM_001348100 [Pleodorina starrii]GLC56473.1 hypothetical protein PLESTB_001111000 [Pleodorina starrii]GLC65950.1 hypothetical protein PLESTF_000365500 [Pleodorina starrii]
MLASEQDGAEDKEPGVDRHEQRQQGQLPNGASGQETCAELIELRQRVARLEAILQTLVPVQPAVVAPQGAAEPAADAATHSSGTCGKATAAAGAPPPPTAAPADTSTTHGSASPSTSTSDVGRTRLASVTATAILPPAAQQGSPSPAAGLVGGGLAPSGGSGANGGPRLGGGFAVAMAATRVVMHQLVLPADVNTLGICTGGQVLSWIDVCAGLSAKTLAHGPCVTASVDAVHFLRPCRLGCVVIIAALVSRTFNTSMEVGVVVESEDMRTGVRHHCCSAHLTFVVRPRPAAAAEGSPLAAAVTAAAAAPAAGTVGLPRVYPTTPDHRAVWEGAEVRRQARLERRTRVRRNPELKDAERICRLKPITHREGGPTLPPAVTLPQQQQQQQLVQQQHISGSGSGSGAAAAGKQRSPPKGPDADPVAAAAAAATALRLAPPVRQRVAPGCTTAYMTQSILPQHANTLNITFGGQVMSWMEQCAYISASRLRAPALLTAAMDSVSFVRPTRVGDILYITAQVTAIFGSSLEVMVSVFGESPYAGAGSSGAATAAAAAASDGDGGGGGGEYGIFHCADAFVTVVAVDERHGSPVPLPFELDPRDPADLLRNQGAVARRAERLALRGEFAASECTRISLDGSHAYSPPPEVEAAVADGDGLSSGRGSGCLDTIPPL